MRFLRRYFCSDEAWASAYEEQTQLLCQTLAVNRYLRGEVERLEQQMDLIRATQEWAEHRHQTRKVRGHTTPRYSVECESCKNSVEFQLRIIPRP